MSHPEIHAEQEYFDDAARHRERRRLKAEEADPESAVAHHGAAAALKESLKMRASSMGGPDTPVAFGRADLDNGETYYVGRAPIFDEDGETLVISWKADQAACYTQSTSTERMGTHLKRHFTTERNTIVDIIEEFLAEGGAAALPAPVRDQLLRELSQRREGVLHDIVQTIEAAQDRVMRAPAEGVLVVQGGPGTGKTVVGLQRISVLIYRDRLETDDMLFVGPSRSFLRYVRRVLPALGDDGVLQFAIEDLSPLRVRDLGSDEPQVGRIKGDARMSELMSRALRSRRSLPQDSIELTVSGSRIRLPAESVRALMEPLHQSQRPHNIARQLLRDQLQRLIVELGAPGSVDVGELRGSREFDNLLDRLWPTYSPQEFLRDLLGSERQLKTHAAGLFDEEESLAIARPQQARLADEPWTLADLALMDELELLLNGSEATRSYRHVVVDEAQDLSPMQLRAIRRRTRGPMTVLGDLAQATGSWAHRSWDEVLEHLAPRTHDLVELTTGYRVPAEVMRVASAIAHTLDLPVEIPTPIRESGFDPEFRAATDVPLLRSAVEVIRASLQSGLRVGVITAAKSFDEVGNALSYESIEWGDGRSTLERAVTVLDPPTSKGLEFDSVVILEPTDIVESGPQGLNELFVASTRTTQRLAFVYAKQLPEVLLPFAPSSSSLDSDEPVARGDITADSLSSSSGESDSGGDQFDHDARPEPRSVEEPRPADVSLNLAGVVLDALAEAVADQVSEVLDVHLWQRFLGKLEEVLDTRAGDDAGESG